MTRSYAVDDYSVTHVLNYDRRVRSRCNSKILYQLNRELNHAAVRIFLLSYRDLGDISGRYIVGVDTRWLIPHAEISYGAATCTASSCRLCIEDRSV